jgi:hypothetical protein
MISSHLRLLQTTLCVCLAATAPALALPAQAQDPPPPLGPAPVASPPSLTPSESTGLGAPEQLVVAGDFAFGFNHVADSGATSLELAPAVDYFLFQDISVGGQVRFAYSKRDPGSSTSFGIGPRAGYHLPISGTLSFYPRLGLYFRHVATTTKVGAVETSGSFNLFSVFVYAPVLFVPVQHLFIGLGPHLSYDLAGADKDTRTFQIGVSSTVGGWFDW